MRIPANPWRFLLPAAVACAVGAIVGSLLGGPWLYYVAKPLTTLLIFALAWKATPSVSPRYRALVLIGIAFSLCGDVFLMLPGTRWFLPGLASFLLAHLCFIAAFFKDSTFAQKAAGFAPFAIFAAINLFFLIPKLPHDLLGPVLAYVFVLASMAGTALARWRNLRNAPTLTESAWHAALGGATFVVSDCVLAWHLFGGGVPLHEVWILSTYFFAIFHIARSAQRD